MITAIIILLSFTFGIISIVLMLRYLYLYRNLRSNFKSFLDFVDMNYIRKNDVILHNATIQALERAKERNHTFEIKAYTKLLQRLKEGA